MGGDNNSFIDPKAQAALDFKAKKQEEQTKRLKAVPIDRDLATHKAALGRYEQELKRIQAEHTRLKSEVILQKTKIVKEKNEAEIARQKLQSETENLQKATQKHSQIDKSLFTQHQLQGEFVERLNQKAIAEEEKHIELEKEIATHTKSIQDLKIELQRIQQEIAQKIAAEMSELARLKSLGARTKDGADRARDELELHTKKLSDLGKQKAGQESSKSIDQQRLETLVQSLTHVAKREEEEVLDAEKQIQALETHLKGLEHSLSTIQSEIDVSKKRIAETERLKKNLLEE